MGVLKDLARTVLAVIIVFLFNIALAHLLEFLTRPRKNKTPRG